MKKALGYFFLLLPVLIMFGLMIYDVGIVMAAQVIGILIVVLATVFGYIYVTNKLLED